MAGATAVVERRAASLFGLQVAPRRGPLALREQRSAPAIIDRPSGGGGGVRALAVVDAGWPRVVERSGTIAYEAAG